MQPVDALARKYDPTTMLLHWATVVLLAALLLGRVAWRVTGGRRMPLAGKGAPNIVAKGTHWGPYALLAGMVLPGMHTVVGLVHRDLWHDGVLSRMLPRG